MITRSGFSSITFSGRTWCPEVTIGISASSLSVLEISRPTRIDLAFSEFIISATPFARTTTRDTEKFAVDLIEIFDTSFSEIVWL